MDVREKLVDLLGRVQQMGVIYKENQMDERYPTIEQIRNTEVAARLIANGVTVQECGHWIYDFNLAGSNFYRCSVCNRQETLLEKEDIYEYCPFCHCGAKMIPKPQKGE